jgi:GntR family transcriptional regulator
VGVIPVGEVSAVAKRYEQVADDLRQQVQTGALTPGERLPSEEALASRYRVGLPTLRQALSVLQAEGLIEKRHGRGNFIREPRQRVEYANDRHWFWDAPDRGADPAVRRPRAADQGIEVDVSVDEVDACRDLASRMGVPPGTRLMEYIHRSNHVGDEAPHSIARSYVVRGMLTVTPQAGENPSPWGDEVGGWLTAAGVELERIIERLIARPPSVEESEALGLAPGVAVLAVERTLFDAEGRVVWVADVVMSGDRAVAVYTTSLCRAHQLC